MNAKLFLLLAITFVCRLAVSGQGQPPSKNATQPQDTLRPVHILNANVYEFRTIDTATQLQILRGMVKIRQEGTYFEADSVIYNEKTQLLEAYGRVFLRDSTGTTLNAGKLIYDGVAKKASFSNNVRLSDGNGTLYTPQMDYDLVTKTGIYTQGGKTINGTTTLTSQRGIYYADSRDVFFSGNVNMTDPNMSLKTDSLLYNTETQIATFVAETTIKNKSSTIVTSEGYYDMRQKQARFGNRIRMEDSTSVLIADNFYFDEASGNGEATGNVQFKDTAQGVLLFANKTVFNRNENRFKATEKPVLVVVQEGDSIYIAADTIYSAYIREIDSSRWTAPVLKTPSTDGTTNNTAATQFITNTIDSTDQNQDKITSGGNPVKMDTTKISETKRTDQQKTLALPSKDYPGTLRFIQAWHNVRIYSDSVQAVSDSLFYATTDSIFQLYHNPIAWSKNSQATGDTLFIYTENKKPKRIAIFENACLGEEIDKEHFFYNQVKARIINSYFLNGEIHRVEANGSAESIYFAQDEDSAFVGMNRTEADKIRMRFDGQAAERISFIRAVKGITYPIRQLPEDQKTLTDFKWQGAKRPRNKYELFY
jgi:lipopolysaccharide export system protein LptA